MKRFFTILLTAMAMLTVALLSAFLSMRLAIHGREVEVPALAGLTIAEATAKASRLGLSLKLENKFYATDTPAGHILGQSPAPGVMVRRDWAIRITESLGSQQVSIPDVVGEAERPATLSIRRLSLDLGTVASISSPGESGIVLAQTPPPNANGVDRPTVSLLVSQPESATPVAFVMPQLTGMSLSAVFTRANAAGLHIASAEDSTPDTASATIPPAPGTAAPTSTYHDSFFISQTHPSTPSTANSTPTPSTGPVSPSSVAVVTAQSPLAGHKVVRGESIHITLTH